MNFSNTLRMVGQTETCRSRYLATMSVFSSGKNSDPPVRPLRMRKNRALLSDLVQSKTDMIVINVSGKRFQTYEGTFASFPNTLLGNHVKLKKYYNKATEEYFFDRNRSAFSGILYYYKSGGILERPQSVSESVFTKEVLFFELGDEALGKREEEEMMEDEGKLPSNKFIRYIWVTFEHPSSSLMAKVVAVFSVFVIILSIIVFCCETIPVLDPHKIPAGPFRDEMKSIWFVLNTFCSGWFTIEFILRFLTAPNKWKFIKTTLNIIDLISILPYYSGLLLSDDKEDSHGIHVLRVVRVVRVIRIFKLTRHSRGLHILGKTIGASFHELLLLCLFLAIGVILFSSAVYYAEASITTGDFRSIPHAFWWAVTTMTTVGYGDITPETLAGKLVGATCVVSGVLVISIPLPVIVNNFKLFCQTEKDRQAREKVRKIKQNEDDMLLLKILPAITGKLRKMSTSINEKFSRLRSYTVNGQTVSDTPMTIVNEQNEPEEENDNKDNTEEASENRTTIW